MPSIRLTDTEKAIVKEYLNGLAPREIAEKLKVSIKTVYKALSKYRKLQREKGLQAQTPTTATSTHSTSTVTAEASISEEALLKVLAKILAEAFKEIQTKPSVSVEKPTVQPVNAELLSALIKEIANLAEQIKELNKNLRSLRYMIKISELPTREEIVASYTPEEETLPSYLKENPWVEVLRKRGLE